ncbi:MAG: fumarylacetoacetate hydrolase family protein [Methanomassiliicoccales archaeon]|nr:fumarylacetoacetate hydrolase family protein [Methanomassiliicoccales archaeon]
MRLATFRVNTEIGPFDRVGAVISGEHIVDLNSACYSKKCEEGDPTPRESADFLMPPDMIQLAKRGERAMSEIRDVISWVGERRDIRGPDGERIFWKMGEVRLLPPVLKPPVLRDFAAFETHLKNTFGKMGVALPEAWYRRPMAFKGNPTTIFGQDASIVWPAYTEKLDYEMEICAVIGKPGSNIPVDRAYEHIFGFTILNDFSARDIQTEEMSNHTGPFKAKDFAWGLGPWIVTTDEIGSVDRVEMSIKVNGDVWSSTSSEAMKWNFAELVSYTSTDEMLNTGDLIGSGTVNGGCGFEIDRWLKPGDMVEIEVKKIGTLKNRIGHPDEKSPGKHWKVAERKRLMELQKGS